ncbi:MAG: hypothetical protein LWW87_07245 [Geobacteraceae bacterium]|nr:hypothetical protein [Geobacteraceae bacterium]
MSIRSFRLLSRCRGRHVVAILYGADGSWQVGSNGVKKPQQVCPRRVGRFGRGQGWELCAAICGQQGHAEQQVVAAAGTAANGATLLLFGHDTICPGCAAVLEQAGVKKRLVVIC